MDLSGALGEAFSADGVFAFASSDFPGTPLANCVELSAPLSVDQIARVDADFSSRSARCLQWTAERRESVLITHGLAVREIVVARLARWSSAAEVLPTAEAGTPMILQARGATAKAETLLHDSGLADEAVQAAMHLIDNPHDEWLIGLAGDPQSGRGGSRAVVAGALLVSGDAGLVHHCTALPQWEGSEATFRKLLDRLLDYALRAGLRHVLTCCDAIELPQWQSAGFIEAGRLYEHVAAE